MPTTTINLTDGLSEWIAGKVASGNYNNASEVIRESLRSLRAQDERDHFELELLRQKVMTGLDQAERGEFSNKDMKTIIKDAKTKMNSKK